MKTFLISEEQFGAIKDRQKKWEYYNNFEDYLKNNDSELMFYDNIGCELSNISKNVYIDCCSSYILFNHPMWVYVIDKEDKLIPFSISRFPQILVNSENYSLFLNKEEIKEIKDFIVKHFYALSEYAKMNISKKTFEDFLNRDRICECLLITESPILDGTETGLPTSVWVDGDRNTQHGARLKFKASESNNTRTWPSCTINDNPQIKNLPNNSKLNNKDLEKIIRFVTYNKDLLLDIAKGTSSFIKSEDILKRLIKIGKNGGPIYSKEMFDEPLFVGDNEDVINVYVNKENGGLEFITEKNDSQTKELIKFVSQNKKFKYQSPFSVSYIPIQRESSGMIEWRCEMKALSQFKELANSKGFNVKFKV